MQTDTTGLYREGGLSRGRPLFRGSAVLNIYKKYSISIGSKLLSEISALAQISFKRYMTEIIAVAQF